MVDKSIVNLINDYLKELINNKINLTKVILYGSYANGNQHLDSDIDLILISPDFDDNRDDLLGLIWKATSVSNYKIEPYPIGEKRFESDTDSPLIQIAKKEGIEINISLN